MGYKGVCGCPGYMRWLWGGVFRWRLWVWGMVFRGWLWVLCGVLGVGVEVTFEVYILAFKCTGES